MNKHFEDAQYYLKRAGETAARGVQEELAPIRERFTAIVGSDEEPEASRIEKVRSDLEELSKKAEGQTKEAIDNARASLLPRLDDSTMEAIEEIYREYAEPQVHHRW